MIDSGRSTSIGSRHRSDALRIFVALWPSDTTRAGLTAIQGTLPWPHGCRLVAPSDMHVTLAFIGALAGEGLDAVRQAVAVRSAAITLKFDKLEVWKGGIAVLTPSGVPEALSALHGRLTASLRTAGVAFDESHPAFAPHVTLARKAQGLAAVAVEPVSWRSMGHVLAASAGGRYSLAARFK
jgi:2'-5' RNA ligase